MKDIERRLIALEIRPTAATLSNVTFSEEPTSLPMTTLIGRISILESKVNNLEPSLSTLHSSISSAPLDPPEGTRREDGQANEPSLASSLTQEQTVQKRIENLEAWVRSYNGGIPINALGFTMRELEGRLMKWIKSLETQLLQINTQELPNRQRVGVQDGSIATRR